MTQFRTEQERAVALTERERDRILNTDQSFRSIVSTMYFDNYNLPCPVLVTVRTVDDDVRTVVLRKSRRGSVEREAQIFQV